MDPRIVEAIVLRRRDLGENDRVVTLLTDTEGKLDAVAKGARKAGAKAAAASEPITKVRVQLVQGRRLAVTTQWEVLDTFRLLRADLGLLARAIYLCDLTAELTVDHEPCTEVYRLLEDALGRLCQAANRPRSAQDRIVYGFELRLLQERGYGLATATCAHCSTDVYRLSRDIRLSFSPAAGGVLCPSCRYKLRDSFAIATDVLHAIDALTTEELDRIEGVHLTADAERAVRKCLRWCIRYRCEKDLKSAALLEAARAAEGAEQPAHSQGAC